LMRKVGLTDYARFAQDLLERVTEHPISFEVFADDVEEMRRQAHTIASWGENVYVKIPVTSTTGESMAPLSRELSEDGVKVNVTALFTTAQVELIAAAVADGASSYISVFAGRIADAGVDPIPIMARSVEIMASAPRSELIWASPREILNLVQADQVGCHIITMTHDLLKKLDNLGKSLEQFSLETVRMFHEDARAAGFTL
jgi:transaldolase